MRGATTVRDNAITGITVDGRGVYDDFNRQISMQHNYGKWGTKAGGGLAIFESVNFTMTNNIVTKILGLSAGIVVSSLYDILFSHGVLVPQHIARKEAPPSLEHPFGKWVAPTAKCEFHE
jgi:hypothetical protein